MVKENSPNVVQMTIEREKTPPRLIRPDLYFVVVSTGYEQRLGLVEIDASNRPIVLFETVYQSTHPVIP